MFRQYAMDKATYFFIPTIRVESNVEGIKISKIDKHKIQEALDQQGFFAPLQVTQYSASTAQIGSVSARKLRVVLTGREQALGLTYSEGEREPFQSWGVTYTATAHENIYDVTIYLYVVPSIVESEDRERLAQRYRGLLLASAWDLTHPQKSEYGGMERFEGMGEYVREHIDEQWWIIKK